MNLFTARPPHPRRPKAVPAETSVSRYLNGNPKVYRIGLIGLSGAGKTCLLAALGMTRAPNPTGCTCDRLPQLVRAPRPAEGRPAGCTNKAVADFYAGGAWLDAAERDLREGRLPRPNEEPFQFRALYRFTAPGRGEVLVELIDYAGELLDPRLTGAEMAGRLRDLLRRLDGLLVLAEVPAAGGDAEEKPLDELGRLRQGLGVWLSEMKKGAEEATPVALAVNKWDRRGPCASPEEREGRLMEFLAAAPAPRHKGLADELANAATADNFRPFALSAFGELELPREGEPRERPRRKGESLSSYGLEEPFLWLVRRRDELDGEALRQWKKNPGWPCFWQMRAPWRTWWAAQDFRRRYSAETEQGQKARGEAKAVARLSVWVWTAHLLAWAPIVALAWMLGEWAFDDYHYGQAEAALSDNQATAERQHLAQQWFEDYAAAPLYRHRLSYLLLLGPEKARQRLKDFRDAKEKALWDKAAEQQSDPLAARPLARAYLDRYPNGQYAPDAGALIAKAERLLHGRADEAALVDAENAFKGMRAGGAPDADALSRLEARRSALPPFPDAEGPELRQRRLKLATEIGDWEQQLEMKKLRQQYAKLMDADRIVEAAETVAGAPDELKDLRDDFCKRCPEKLEARARRYKDKDEEAGVNWLGAVQSDAHVRELLSKKDLGKIDDLTADLKDTQDLRLYQDFRKEPTDEAAKKYLDRGLRNSMKKEVAGYQAFLRINAGVQKLTVKVAAINWGDWWENYQNSVQVDVAGAPVIMNAGAISHMNNRSTDVGAGGVTQRLDDVMEVRIGVKNTQGFATWWAGNRPGGKAVYNGTLRALDGKTIDLDGDPNSMGASVTFKVEGMAQPPDLPDWGK